MDIDASFSEAMSEAREKAENQLARDVRDDDCCYALPRRYKAYIEGCLPYR